MAFPGFGGDGSGCNKYPVGESASESASTTSASTHVELNLDWDDKPDDSRTNAGPTKRRSPTRCLDTAEPNEALETHSRNEIAAGQLITHQQRLIESQAEQIRFLERELHSLRAARLDPKREQEDATPKIPAVWLSVAEVARYYVDWKGERRCRSTLQQVLQSLESRTELSRRLYLKSDVDALLAQPPYGLRFAGKQLPGDRKKQ